MPSSAPYVLQRSARRTVDGSRQTEPAPGEANPLFENCSEPAPPTPAAPGAVRPIFEPGLEVVRSMTQRISIWFPRYFESANLKSTTLSSEIDRTAVRPASLRAAEELRRGAAVVGYHSE